MDKLKLKLKLKLIVTPPRAVLVFGSYPHYSIRLSDTESVESVQWTYRSH